MKLTSFFLALFSVGACYGGYGDDGTGDCDPNTRLGIGSTWSFQLTQGDFLPVGQAAIGSFKIQANGVLQVTATVSNAGIVTRRAEATGRYIVYPDCTGGELLFMINALPMQLEFVYANAGESMFLVADSMQPKISQATALSGTARRTVLPCPPQAVVNNIVNFRWAFRTLGGYFPGSVGSASAGYFDASFDPANPNEVTGLINGVETVNASVLGVTRLAKITGKYEAYPACGGGNLLIMNRGHQYAPSLQLEFVFAGPKYDELYMITSQTGAWSPQIVTGTARVEGISPAALGR